MSTGKKIRVLVVDDSALARRAISEALKQDPELLVVGGAVDPYEARHHPGLGNASNGRSNFS